MKHFINLPDFVSAVLLAVLLKVLTILLCVVPVHATSASAHTDMVFPGTITLHTGKLTAQLKAVPLGRVMEEVSRLSGAQVVWLRKNEQEASVSVEFHDLPMPEALQHLLREHNFLLFYTVAEEEDVQLTQIWISAKGQEQVLLPPSPSSNLAVSSLPSDEAAFTDEETTDSIIQTALHDSDAAIRLLTVSQLGMRAQEDVRAKSVIAQMALSDSDPAVRNVAADMLDSLEEREKLGRER